MHPVFAAVLGLMASSGLASPAGLVERACGGDNCGRGVSKATAVNKQDCASFMTKTVTPCPTTTVTATTWSTATSYTGSAAPSSGSRQRRGNIEARAVTSAATCPTTSTATAIPTYASACSNNVAKYSSACSCLGVTTGITTVASPTATYYITSTTTTTVTAVYSTFYAQATNGIHDGTMLHAGHNPNTVGNANDSLVLTPGQPAEVFVIDGAGRVYGNGGDPTKVWRSYHGGTVNEGFSQDEDVNPKLTCKLTAISLSGAANLTCLTGEGNYAWENCPTEYTYAIDLGYGVYQGTEGPSDRCFGLDLITIPIH